MILTGRLSLVPINIDHAAGLFELWSDFEVIKYTYAPLCRTLKECEDRASLFIDGNQANVYNFSILLDDKVIGISGFPPMDEGNGEYGFYYQLRQSEWGKGYGYEVAAALLNYIKTESEVVRIYAEAAAVNSASLLILKRLGFEQVGIQELSFTKNNMQLDLIQFEYEVQ